MNNIDLKIPLDKNVEVMAIGFQPRDVEIGVGGTLLKMAHRGYTIVICDLTDGNEYHEGNNDELITIGEKAGRILHVSDRINLSLKNFRYNISPHQVETLAKCIKKYRPEVILAPSKDDWNNNTNIADNLLQNALALAKEKRTDKALQIYVPKWIFYYTLMKPTIPQIVVNITSTFEGKLEAIKLFQSESEQQTTSPSSLSSLEHPFFVESRARYFGSLIGCRFGEGLSIEKPLPIDDIYELINP